MEGLKELEGCNEELTKLRNAGHLTEENDGLKKTIVDLQKQLQLSATEFAQSRRTLPCVIG